MRIRIEDGGTNGSRREGALPGAQVPKDEDEDEDEDQDEDEDEKQQEEEGEEEQQQEEQEQEDGGVYRAGNPIPQSKYIGKHPKVPATAMASHSCVCCGNHCGNVAHWRSTVFHALSSLSGHGKRLHSGVPSGTPAMSTPPAGPCGFVHLGCLWAALTST